MTDKELKKLSRTELLELMLYLRKELDDLKEENEKLKEQIDNTGSELKAICEELKVSTRGVRLLCENQGIALDEDNDDKFNDLSKESDKKEDMENDGGAQP